MEERIREFLKEVINEDRYKLKLNDIGVKAENTQHFTLVFHDRYFSVTMSKTSDLKQCIRSVLNNYADILE